MTGGGLRDADTDTQWKIVTDRQVTDQLRTERTEAVQPGAFTGVPRVTHIAEDREREFVGAQGQMSERVPEQRKRHAVLGRERRRATAGQYAAGITPDRERAKCPDLPPEPEQQRTGRHSADAKAVTDRAVEGADRAAEREDGVGESEPRAQTRIHVAARADLVEPARGALLFPATIEQCRGRAVLQRHGERRGDGRAERQTRRSADAIARDAARADGGEIRVGNG